jgi:hypothetical protein
MSTEEIGEREIAVAHAIAQAHGRAITAGRLQPAERDAAIGGDAASDRGDVVAERA